MIPLRWPRVEGTRPLRFLARRVVQVMAESASANMILGERVAPNRFAVLRLATDAQDRAEQESLFADSRDAIVAEVMREARAREFRLRGALTLELYVLLLPELEGARTRKLLRTLVEEPEIAPALERLREEKELILVRRCKSLQIESRPPGAAVYLDDRQLDRVTPCRIDDLPAGRHRIALSLPGYLLHEGELEVAEEASGGRRGSGQTYFAELEPEPPMGVLELITFPGQARAEVLGEVRETPTRFRLPAGPIRIEITRPDYAPLVLDYDLPPCTESRPARVQCRLEYAGADRDLPVGRLVIYKPDPLPLRRGQGGPESEPPLFAHSPRPQERSGRPGSRWNPPAPHSLQRGLRPMERPEETIASFFGDDAAEPEEASSSTVTATLPSPSGSKGGESPEVLGERPLYKGVLVIGRADPAATVVPDVKLFDPGNTVSRGCHAWLHIYTDPGTGAEYNTFVIHNNSAGGILVDGRVVMDSVALGDESEIQIGIFRMRVFKETPAPSVEF